MNTSKILASLFVVTMIGATGCASLCERKDAAMTRKCAGTSVNYSADPVCEQKVRNCNEGQMAQFEGYVKCLESMNECSLESISACGSKYPGGRGLQCANAFN